ncbi:glutathione S-transferase domain-containing protein [Rhexocercosporidium sp. MPI-PUGE-AT-0058]|nr:glutathione S-transferase domain-containing protein [Rhexocercosporidium sp. MPI-PUGE-AT-0058]
MGSTSPPNIILYTNHRCPWAHRAHIALAELGLEYKEEIIDLSTPRTPEYLKVNPRGLVPSISYNGEIVTESAIVAQFLADSQPSHLVKTSGEEGGALQRARIAYFVDAYFSKVNGGFWSILSAEGAEKERLGDAFVNNVAKEIEPLLQDAAPFFGGSKRLTMAEVQTGSFLLRVLSYPKYQELNLLPRSILDGFEAKTPAFWKWANAVVAEKSVNFIFDEKLVAEGTAARIAKIKAAAK